MERAKKFTVGGLTTLAIWESLKPNYAWAQQVPKDDARIKTGYEDRAVAAGQRQHQGLLRAAGERQRQAAGGARHPREPRAQSVRRGRRAPLRGRELHRVRARRPDVGRRLPGNDEQGAVKFREVNGPKMFEDFVAAAQWLKARPESTGKLGAIGFCFGGGVVNNLAVRLGGDLAAGAPFYGAPVSAEDAAKIKAPMMLHYADPTKDTGIGARIPAYEAALKANHNTYQLFIYEGAQHGFHNDTTPRYDEAAAKLAWSRTLEHFNKYVRGGSGTA